MNTALEIGLVLAAWTLVPFPLAVLVGRAFRAQGAAVRAGTWRGRPRPARI